MTRQVSIPTSATKVSDLVSQDYCKWLQVQAPSTNSGNILYGDLASQPMFIAPGDSQLLPISSLKDLYIRGTSGDLVNLFFQG